MRHFHTYITPALEKRFISTLRPKLMEVFGRQAIFARNPDLAAIDIYVGKDTLRGIAPDMRLVLSGNREVTLVTSSSAPVTIGHMRRTITFNRAIRKAINEVHKEIVVIQTATPRFRPVNHQ